jgi:hypothetical protein
VQVRVEDATSQDWQRSAHIDGAHEAWPGLEEVTKREVLGDVDLELLLPRSLRCRRGCSCV